MSEAPAATSARRGAAVQPAVRAAVVALLVVLAYIHLSLLVDILGPSNRLGALFALDVLGLVCAIAGVLAGRRWLGWVPAIAFAALSAVGRLGGTASSGVRRLLMGSGGIRYVPSHALPTVAGVNALGDLSVALELAVVGLAAYALWRARGLPRV